jgi:Pvc16 N-terminal domain
MSNVLAIAAVTSTIRYVLERALGGTQPGPVGAARVTTSRPDSLGRTDDGGADVPKGLNVYLYRVTPNHAWNLTDLPTRRTDGALTHRPIAALDLHYLISGYGDDGELDPQRLLGRAILALAVNPVLTRDLVAAAMAEYGDDPATAYLTAADLGDQVELVKLAPSPLSLEELSRLWGVLAAPHLLSVTYLATVVLIEADLTPATAPPVQEPVLEVSPTP